MKLFQLLFLGTFVLLFAGCSASIPIRPQTFFLLQNDRTEEAEPERAKTPGDCMPIHVEEPETPLTEVESMPS